MKKYLLLVLLLLMCITTIYAEDQDPEQKKNSEVQANQDTPTAKIDKVETKTDTLNNELNIIKDNLDDVLKKLDTPKKNELYKLISIIASLLIIIVLLIILLIKSSRLKIKNNEMHTMLSKYEANKNQNVDIEITKEYLDDNFKRLIQLLQKDETDFTSNEYPQASTEKIIVPHNKSYIKQEAYPNSFLRNNYLEKTDIDSIVKTIVEGLLNQPIIEFEDNENLIIQHIEDLKIENNNFKNSFANILETLKTFTTSFNTITEGNKYISNQFESFQKDINGLRKSDNKNIDSSVEKIITELGFQKIHIENLNKNVEELIKEPEDIQESSLEQIQTNISIGSIFESNKILSKAFIRIIDSLDITIEYKNFLKCFDHHEINKKESLIDFINKLNRIKSLSSHEISKIHKLNPLLDFIIIILKDLGREYFKLQYLGPDKIPSRYSESIITNHETEKLKNNIKFQSKNSSKLKDFEPEQFNVIYNNLDSGMIYEVQTLCIFDSEYIYSNLAIFEKQ